jgi:hypothetical protein
MFPGPFTFSKPLQKSCHFGPLRRSWLMQLSWFIRINFGMALLVVLALCPFVEARAQPVAIFDGENYPGAWTLVTNPDSTITATEAAVHRRGTEVYSRALLLETAADQSCRTDAGSATEAKIRSFISGYRPPAIPYTSEAAANRTGREKFDCLEFAEDLVKTAQAKNIPAEVIGILFEGKLTGHAVAGFPTSDDGMLYFDSTPGAGRISHAAHEAQVEVGRPYRRAGGGELAGVGSLPVRAILPVTRLLKFAGDLPDGQNSVPIKTRLIVAAEHHVQAREIDYAGPDTLQVSDEQLAKWNAASNTALTELAREQEQQKATRKIAADRAAARALAADEKLADDNDVYGQLRMGERFLMGDGVEKDPIKAAVYLRQAAGQGSPTAARELKSLEAGIANRVWSLEEIAGLSP